MKPLLALQAGVNSLASAAAAVCLLALTALLLVEVALRALGRPIFGAQEIAEMGMILVVFGALAQLEAKAGQIRVDLLAPRLGGALALGIAKASALLALLIWGALAFALIEAAGLSALLGARSNLLGMPHAAFQAGLAGLALLAALANLTRLCKGGQDG